MAQSVRINDKLPSFSKSAKSHLQIAIKEGAKDILEKSRNKAPFDQGNLRSESYIDQKGSLKWRISYNAPYAHVQEKGSAGGRVFRNYTTAGTGKKYLSNAGTEVALQIAGIFKKHGQRARP